MNGIGLATLRFETDIVAANYAACQTLGGLLLIDPHSNDTVALGVVEADADQDDERARRGRPSSRHAVENSACCARCDAGRRAPPRDRMAAGAVLTGLIVFVLTGGHPGLALAGVSADIVLRPALGIALRVASVLDRGAAQGQRTIATLTIDGGGI